MAVPSIGGALVADWATNVGDAATATVGAGQTQNANQLSSGDKAAMRAVASTEAGSSTTTMSWSLTASKEWGILAVSLRPAP